MIGFSSQRTVSLQEGGFRTVLKFHREILNQETGQEYVLVPPTSHLNRPPSRKSCGYLDAQKTGSEDRIPMGIGSMGYFTNL